MREKIVKILNKIFREMGIDNIDLDTKIEIPPQEKFGDYSLPCFFLSPLLKKSPQQIALEIAEKIKKVDIIEKVEVVNGYVNIFIKKEKIAEEILNTDFKIKKSRERIMIEYEAPNTNKPLHLGHLRNVAIGESISRILEFFGNKVIRANLFNDRGIHICQTILAYEKFFKGKNPDKKSDHFVGELYVKFNQEAKKDPSLHLKAQEMLKKFEEGDKKIINLWKKINEWAIKGINETNKLFGVKFDIEFRESNFYKKSKKIIEEGIKKGIFFKDKNGNIVAKLSPTLPDKVVLRKDGTSVYITNDLVLTPYKFSKYKLDKSYWVVGSEQNLYFQQLFEIFRRLGYEWYDKCFHISYGMVFLPEGKMKSREGKIIDADNFIEDIRKLAEEELKKRYKLNEKELKKRSLKIALAAIKYFFLKVERTKDIYFNKKESVSFEGNTGPYLQYSYVRANSIIKKAGGKVKKKIRIKKLNQYEINLIKKISLFPSVLNQAYINLAPNIIANYSFELCQAFNEFYSFCPVIKSEKEEREKRLAITKCFIKIMKKIFFLLDIPLIEEM